MAAAKKKAVSSSGQSDGHDRATSQDRVVYSEFGNTTNAAAFERAVPDLPPAQQNLRVQASRKGRGGKTVTVVTGFETRPESLMALLKQLKTQCGAGGAVKDNELEIQGDHRQKVLEFLIAKGDKAKISGG